MKVAVADLKLKLRLLEPPGLCPHSIRFVFWATWSTECCSVHTLFLASRRLPCLSTPSTIRKIYPLSARVWLMNRASGCQAVDERTPTRPNRIRALTQASWAKGPVFGYETCPKPPGNRGARRLPVPSIRSILSLAKTMGISFFSTCCVTSGA